jgi:hypothetical protein
MRKWARKIILIEKWARKIILIENKYTINPII